MNMLLPKEMLTWVDRNRGPLSRQAFIVRCIYKIMELDKIKDMTTRD